MDETLEEWLSAEVASDGLVTNSVKTPSENDVCMYNRRFKSIESMQAMLFPHAYSFLFGWIPRFMLCLRWNSLFF
jgi:hypothetical protein